MCKGACNWVCMVVVVPCDAAVRGAALGGGAVPRLAAALPPRPLQLRRLPADARGGVRILVGAGVVLAGPGHCGSGERGRDASPAAVVDSSGVDRDRHSGERSK